MRKRDRHTLDNNYNSSNNSNYSNVKGLCVEVRNNDINYALRKFKKKIQEDGLLQELRRREFYEKPSETRKKAKAAGRARWLKKQAKMDLDFSPSQYNKKR